MTIQCLYGPHIDGTHFIWSYTNDRSIFLMQLKHVVVPCAPEIADISLNATELRQSWAWNFGKRMKGNIVNDFYSIKHHQKSKNQSRM
jgi:hypothetical protein